MKKMRVRRRQLMSKSKTSQFGTKKRLRQRYSLAELLHGVTEEKMARIIDDTRDGMEGEPVGAERV